MITFLSIVNNLYSQTKIRIYNYSMAIHTINIYTKSYDTTYKYFKLIKDGNFLYLLDSIKTRDTTYLSIINYDTLIITEDLKSINKDTIYIGEYYLENGISFLKFPGKSLDTIYNKNFNFYSYYMNLSFLSSGKVKYCEADSVINGSICFKFCRFESGNPGRDIPQHIAVEYVDSATFIPIYSKIEYSIPWREINILCYSIENY